MNEDEELIDLIKKSKSKNEISLKFYGYSNKKTYKKIDEFISKNGINDEHLNKKIKYCPNCGNIVTKKGNTFCNRSCSASYTNKGKIKTTEEKINISNGLLLYHFNNYDNKKYTIVDSDNKNNNSKIVVKRLTKFCEYCNTEFTPKKGKQKFCSPSCGTKNKHTSDETKEKLRNIMNKKVKNGTHQGWKSRSKLDRSYPEKYFEGYFNNENIIGWEPELPVGKYFIDFGFIERKIALEIDGKQHEYSERKIKDKEKDTFLTENGWAVFRIKWYNPINKKNKQLLYEQIEIFKKLMNK